MSDQVGTIFIELTLDGQKFTTELKKAEQTVSSSASTMGKELSGAPSQSIDLLISKFKQLATITAGAAGFYGIKNLIQESTMLSARVETLGVVVNVVGRNLGYSSEQVSGFVENVKKMGITTQEAQSSITKMAQAHLDLTQASKLARVAQDAAVIGNINSSEALGRMIHGITTLQPEILRTIGITVNFEQEYAKAANTLGKSAMALSQNEKQQIAFNAVLEKGKDIAGVYEEAMGTVGKQLNSLPRYIEEVKSAFGEFFKPILGEIVAGWTEKLKEWNKEIDKMKAAGEWSEFVHSWTEKIRAFGLSIGAAALALVAFKTAATVTAYFTALASGATLATGAVAALTLALGKLALLGAAVYATVQFGAWVTGFKERYEEERKLLDKAADWVREQREWAAEQKALQAAMKNEAKQGTSWEDLQAKLGLDEKRLGSKEAVEKLKKSYVKMISEAVEKGNDELRAKFEKEKKLELQFEVSVIGMSSYEKELASLFRNYQKTLKDYAGVGSQNLQVIHENFAAKTAEINRKHLEDFNKTIDEMRHAREKAIQEAKISAGDKSIMPTESLAEVNTWLKEMKEKFKNSFTDTSEMVVKLEKEAQEKRMDIIREFNIKRLEAEKQVIQKNIEGIEKYRDSLIKAYDESIARINKYKETIDKVNSTMSMLGEWEEKRKLATMSTGDQMKYEREKLEKLISAARGTGDMDKIQSAIAAYIAFMEKYEGKTGQKGIAGFIWGKENFSDLEANIEKLKTEMTTLSNTTQAALNAEQIWAESLKLSINDANFQIEEMKQKILDIDTLLQQYRAFQIDTSPALMSLAEVERQIAIIQGKMSMGTSSFSYVVPGEEAPPMEGPIEIIGGGVSNYTVPSNVNTTTTSSSNSKVNMNITVNGVNDPEAIARKIIKPLQTEMRRQGVFLN